jgi:hypothetical protein
MRRAMVIAVALMTFGVLSGDAWAGTISLKDHYLRIHILRVCMETGWDVHAERSCKPASPSRAKRSRYLRTVLGSIPIASATALTLQPSERRSTISIRRCGVLRAF